MILITLPPVGTHVSQPHLPSTSEHSVHTTTQNIPDELLPTTMLRRALVPNRAVFAAFPPRQAAKLHPPVWAASASASASATAATPFGSSPPSTTGLVSSSSAKRCYSSSSPGQAGAGSRGAAAGSGAGAGTQQQGGTGSGGNNNSNKGASAFKPLPLEEVIVEVTEQNLPSRKWCAPAYGDVCGRVRRVELTARANGT